MCKSGVGIVCHSFGIMICHYMAAVGFLVSTYIMIPVDSEAPRTTSLPGVPLGSEKGKAWIAY